ncbi:MAG: diguanylate cyclase domain-containing protein [Cyanobacteriota bacterium]
MATNSPGKALLELVDDAIAVGGADLAAIRRQWRRVPPGAVVYLLLLACLPLLMGLAGHRYQRSRQAFVLEQQQQRQAAEAALIHALGDALDRDDRKALRARLQLGMADGTLASAVVADPRGQVLAALSRPGPNASLTVPLVARLQVQPPPPWVAETIEEGDLQIRWRPLGQNRRGWLELKTWPGADSRLLERLDRQQWLATSLGGLGLASCVPLGILLARHREREQQRLLAAERSSADLQAQHDALTGLLNRNGIEQVLQNAIHRVSSDPEGWLALCVVDLDDFTAVNETEGVPAGDRVLVEAARRLRVCARSHDYVGRLDGDVFVCVLDPCPIAQAPVLLSERILEAFRLPFALDQPGEEVRLMRQTVSIGIVAADGRALLSPSILLYRGDAAMHTAKAEGKDRWHRMVLPPAPVPGQPPSPEVLPGS